MPKQDQSLVGTDQLVRELIQYQPTELERVEQRVKLAEEKLAEAKEPADVAALLRCLDMLADRKRILLGIPLPGVRRQSDGGRRSRAPSLPVIDVTDKPAS